MAVDALIRRLEELGANVLPIFSYSLKHNPDESDGPSRALSQCLCRSDGSSRVHCVINTMGMSMGDLSKEGSATVASGWAVDYLERLNVPIIQGIVSTGTEALSPLPEANHRPSGENATDQTISVCPCKRLTS